MKIAYLTNSRFPSERAHAVQIVHMCNAFAALGHEVMLFVTDRATEITETPETFYGVPFRFAFKRISVPDMVSRIAKIPALLRPIAYSVQRAIFVCRFAFRSNEKFDLIYGRDEWVLAPLLFLRKDTPVVWESHEAKFSLAVRWLFKRSKRVVVISEGIREFYIQQGIPAEKILVAHDAIDESFLQEPITQDAARSRLGLVSDKPVAMYIGGFDAWKGVETFFASAALTDAVQCVAIGGKAEEIETYRARYPKVLFLGSRPYSELRHNQQAADLLVIPNTAKVKLSADYTSPLKLFAYLTAKKPLVVSDIPSIRRVVSDEHAFFFKADDAGDLARTLESALSNKDEARTKAAAAFALSQRYTWTARARAIVEFVTVML